MGIIKAATSMISGSLADSWLEVIEPDDLSQDTLLTSGVAVRRDDKRGSNKKGTADFITDGSIIHVPVNTMMLLVDGGKIIDFSAEEGYYTVSNDTAPSLFSGSLKESIDEAFNRFKFGGVTPQKQQVFFVNLAEIKGIKFGTPSPLQYFDNFYNAELFLRAFGNYSVKISDPILFYANTAPRNLRRVTISDINEQFLAEFIMGLTTSINQLSTQGVRISYLPSKSLELSQFMSNALDESWKSLRGIEVVAVAVESISYTDDSQNLINMRNKGAMLGDAAIRQGFVQGSIAEGLKDAGSNPSGSANAFVGMGVGMNAGAGLFQNNATPQANANTWICPKCNTQNTGNFCSNCGSEKPKPQATSGVKIEMRCSSCEAIVDLSNGVPKFCPECGQPFVAKPVE
ncbi:MAG: SPFH domain-containing protein [Streptococcaceae bacterium]|jgi:membrane protease subunit (stomatin/prohibitin family)|nr:SPFH domain-containing protein [Streptococcaceae bacterium]